jgi:hypothetical protein
MNSLLHTTLSKALEDGVISTEQYDIFCYCYYKASRPEFCVHSYSAANVCRFRWLDATTANVKRYERAAADLLARNLIRRDYYKIDPTRSAKNGRTYCAWVPFPARFLRIGTPEENDLSLWKAHVGLVVGDNVDLPCSANAEEHETSQQQQTDNVGLFVGLEGHQLSIKDQENTKTGEIEPSKPPSGRLLPLPSPSGRDAQTPPGSESQNLRARKSLTPDQCAKLDDSARLFAEFCNWLYSFVPDIDAVTKLLRNFTAKEVLFATINQFEPWSKFRKDDMAHFFARGAKTLIEAARIKHCSEESPVWFKGDSTFKRFTSPSEFNSKWHPVIAAYNEAFPDAVCEQNEVAVSTK